MLSSNKNIKWIAFFCSNRLLRLIFIFNDLNFKCSNTVSNINVLLPYCYNKYTIHCCMSLSIEINTLPMHYWWFSFGRTENGCSPNDESIAGIFVISIEFLGVYYTNKSFILLDTFLYEVSLVDRMEQLSAKWTT